MGSSKKFQSLIIKISDSSEWDKAQTYLERAGYYWADRRSPNSYPNPAPVYIRGSSGGIITYGTDNSLIGIYSDHELFQYTRWHGFLFLEPWDPKTPMKQEPKFKEMMIRVTDESSFDEILEALHENGYEWRAPLNEGDLITRHQRDATALIATDTGHILWTSSPDSVTRPEYTLTVKKVYSFEAIPNSETISIDGTVYSLTEVQNALKDLKPIKQKA